MEDNGPGRGAGGATRHSGRRRLTPALLSLLVFPGLGQLALGRVARGLLFALPSLVLLGALVRRLWTEVHRLLPVDDPDALLDPMLPFRLTEEVHRANASFFGWVTAGVVVLWALSALDAWRASNERARRGPLRK